MKRDTKRIEQLLANATESRELVRAEITGGGSLQHVYDELGGHERLFATRLRELREFNEFEETPEGQARRAEAAKFKAQTEADNAANAEAWAKTLARIRAQKYQAKRSQLEAAPLQRLLVMLESLNSPRPRDQKISLPANAGKDVVVNTLLKASGFETEIAAAEKVSEPRITRGELLAKTVAGLLEIVETMNAEPGRVTKITLAANAKKAAIVNAILLAAGYSVTPEEASEGA